MLKSADCRDKRLAKELLVTRPIGKGKSIGARRIQEYLWVNGIKPVIDGEWGDGTQAGLDAFCASHGMPSPLSVDQALMDLLAQPLLRAANTMTARPTLEQTVTAFAEQQLKEHPIEIGGANAGPWVLLVHGWK